MATLIPVEHDPFAQDAMGASGSFTPVDHDPFAKPKIGIGEDLAKSVGSNMVGGALDIGMTLPNIINQAAAGPQMLYRGIRDTFQGNPTDNSPLYQPFFGSSDVEKLLGTNYEPQTTAGKIVALPTRIAAGIAGAKGLQELPSSKIMTDETSGRPISAQQKRFDSMMGLIRPKETPSVIEDTALQRSSAGGIMNKQTYTPTQREADIANTIADIGVKPSNPLVDNLQIINNAKNAEAIKLKGALDKTNLVLRPDDFNKMGQKIAEGLDANPLINSDGETVNKILKLAQKTLDDNPKTAAGLLQARKDFDFHIQKFQPSGLDTSSPATAFRYTSKIVRQTFNDTIADLVPDAGVKQSLMRQNHMYEAMDNIATKIPSQGTNRFSRFLQTPAGKVTKYAGGTAAAATVGDYVVNKLGSKP